MDVGFDMKYSPLSAQISVGAGPYGGSKLSAGIGLSYAEPNGPGGSLSASFSTNFQTTSVGFKAGVMVLGLGASMSSNQTKPSLGIGGLEAGVSSSSEPNLTVQTSGIHTPDIPLGVPGLSLSRMSSASFVGSVYQPTI